MGRRAKHTFTLSDGRVVGAGFKVRAGYFRLQFAHPTEPGKYVEHSTGVPVPDRYDPRKDPPADAFQAAAQLILRAYSATLPPDPKRITWDRALEELDQTAALTEDSRKDYRKTIANLRAILPESRGPADITPELAARFKRLYASTPYTRSPKSDAKRYTRGPVTVGNALRKLASLWSVHFKELGYVRDNPWADLSRPEVPARRVVIPDEEHFAAFFQAVRGRYPDWELIHLFLSVKSLAGCRTFDLCAARSDQLRGRTLTLTRTKTKSPRPVPLPKDIADALHRIKGPTWVWERYTEDAKVVRPGVLNRETFSPRTLYWAVSNIFREYNRQHPDKRVKPHDLRKRAITLTTLATGSVDQTAEAIGLDPQTARRYYNDAGKSLRGRELLERMADVLRPK